MRDEARAHLSILVVGAVELCGRAPRRHVLLECAGGRLLRRGDSGRLAKRVRELLVAAMSGEDFLTIDRPRNKDPRLGTPIQTLLFHSTRFYVPKLSQLH